MLTFMLISFKNKINFISLRTIKNKRIRNAIDFLISIKHGNYKFQHFTSVISLINLKQLKTYIC